MEVAPNSLLLDLPAAALDQRRLAKKPLLESTRLHQENFRLIAEARK